MCICSGHGWINPSGGPWAKMSSWALLNPTHSLSALHAHSRLIGLHDSFIICPETSVPVLDNNTFLLFFSV